VFLDSRKRLASLFHGKRRTLWAVIVLLPLAVVVLGCFLWPEVFWDGFVYRYIWGPVVSDLEGRPVEGVPEGYNIVNTVIYALLLAGALLLMYKILKRIGLNVDLGFVLASIPLFLFGGVARALEDASLFSGWAGYWFISPLIYLLVGLLFTLSGIVGYLARGYKVKSTPAQATRVFALFVIGLLGLYFLITLIWEGDFAYLLPFYQPLLFGVLAIFVFHRMTLSGMDPLRSSVFSTGLLLLFLACSYAIAFIFQDSWKTLFAMENGYLATPRPWEAVIIPCIALVLTAAVYIAGRLLRGRWSIIAAPLASLMFFAHFLDGSATYRGIDLYGYGEKHVLPTALIDIFGTAAVMLPLKLLLVLLILCMIDVLYKEELRPYPNLGNIMKYAVIFLGLSPGMRDLTRISLGV
jgi:uncharacterized membrane protein